MTEKELNNLREKLSRQIILFNGLLILFVISLYTMNGFLKEEFYIVLGLLAPITALYIGSLFKYLGGDLNKEKQEEKIVESNLGKNSKVSKSNKGVVHLIIPLHFLFILLLILSKSVFNFITFEDMILIFTFIESSFGGYIGHIIYSLYQVTPTEPS